MQSRCPCIRACQLPAFCMEAHVDPSMWTPQSCLMLCTLLNQEAGVLVLPAVRGLAPAVASINRLIQSICTAKSLKYWLIPSSPHIFLAPSFPSQKQSGQVCMHIRMVCTPMNMQKGWCADRFLARRQIENVNSPIAELLLRHCS